MSPFNNLNPRSLIVDNTHEVHFPPRGNREYRSAWKQEVESAQSYNQRMLNEYKILVRYIRARSYPKDQANVLFQLEDALDSSGVIHNLDKDQLLKVQDAIDVVDDKIARTSIIGALVSCRVGNQTFFGWSLHNHHDAFSKKIGLAVAINRMMKLVDGGQPEMVPHSITDDFQWFVERSNKYFRIFV